MMKSFAVALFALASTALAQSGLMINSPTNVVQCEPLLFSWSGGTAPYFLSLLPPGQSSGTAIKTFPTESGTSFTWDVDLASGTSFTAAIKDSQGNQAFSSQITIGSGSDSSCLNSAVSDNGSAGSGGSSTTAGGSSAGSSATTTGSAASKTASGSAASSTASSTSGAGRSTVGAFGLASTFCLLGAALF